MTIEEERRKVNEIKVNFIRGLTELIEQYGDNTELEAVETCCKKQTIRLTVRGDEGEEYLINIGNYFSTGLDEYE